MLVVIQPYIFIFQPFCVFILIISLYRIFQDPFCKVKAAVSVNACAHFVVYLLFFHLCKIRFSKIQFHVSMCLFQNLRRQNRNFLPDFTFFFHLLCDRRILQIRHALCKLFHICFQSLLIHFFREKILPAKLCQFFQAHCHNAFQISIALFKILIYNFVIKTVNKGNQTFCIFCISCLIYFVPNLFKSSLHLITSICQLITEHSDPKSSKNVPISGQYLKLLIQNIRTRLLLKGNNSGALITYLLPDGLLYAKLCQSSKASFLCSQIYFFHQIHSHKVFIIKSGESSLLYPIVKSNCF